MAKNDKINMPGSMSKKFLIANGLHCAPEAVQAFEDKLRQFATDLANKVGEVTKSKKRKTVYAEDVNKVEVPSVVSAAEIDEAEQIAEDVEEGTAEEAD